MMLTKLIDRNVTATLTPNYKFYLGLVDGGAFEASVDEVIEQTWAQESEIRRGHHQLDDGLSFAQLPTP